MIAQEYMHSLLNNQQVRLEFDVERFDNYNRVLAYVYLMDNTMINLTLLEKGYAKTMPIEPNTKYADIFSKMEGTTKSYGDGFWGEESNYFLTTNNIK
jgi:micrococcal nuclease